MYENITIIIHILFQLELRDRELGLRCRAVIRRLYWVQDEWMSRLFHAHTALYFLRCDYKNKIEKSTAGSYVTPNILLVSLHWSFLPSLISSSQTPPSPSNLISLTSYFFYFLINYGRCSLINYVIYGTIIKYEKYLFHILTWNFF